LFNALAFLEESLDIPSSSQVQLLFLRVREGTGLIELGDLLSQESVQPLTEAGRIAVGERQALDLLIVPEPAHRLGWLSGLSCDRPHFRFHYKYFKSEFKVSLNLVDCRVNSFLKLLSNLGFTRLGRNSFPAWLLSVCTAQSTE